MSDIAIRVEGLSKQYRIGGPQARYKTLRESLVGAVQSPVRRAGRLLRGEAATDHQETIWALKDVSFEVKHGEVLGIIGRNGAGKSTLLKILSRITAPTEGAVDLYGRVGSLLEVGTGFHPELTGRENIYLNGAILGMKRAEIDQKFDEIAAFSGVANFLDTPVKHYSSGMHVRLAFAVAAHLDPEILLVDEVLAVGDAAFQEKCLGKMGEVAGEGRTVLFVSHNMSAVASLCSRTFWLDSGRIATSGKTGTAVDEYLNSIRMRDGVSSLKERQDRTGTSILRATEVRIEDLLGNRLRFAESGQGIRFVIDYAACSEEDLNEVIAHLTVVNSQNQRLFCCMSDIVRSPLRNLPSSGSLVCALEELPLVPGSYDLHLSIHANKQLADKILSSASFQVVEGDFFNTGRLPSESGGSLLVHHTWQVE